MNYRIYLIDNQVINQFCLLLNFTFIIFNFRFKSVNYFYDFDKLVVLFKYYYNKIADNRLNKSFFMRLLKGTLIPLN